MTIIPALSALRPRRLGRPGITALGGLVLVAAIAGCSRSTGGSSATPTMAASSSFTAASVTAKGLQITGGYVPKPASPDVAAAYLTITNTTDHAIRLTKVVTSVTNSVMAMNETDRGGVGSMTDLSSIDIAAHGTYHFVPNHAHLMLENPTTLRAGELVSMTLTFTEVGPVKIMLPVVPLGQLPSGVPSSLSSAGTSLPAMPGMSRSTSG